jgi:hypothetical protein
LRLVGAQRLELLWRHVQFLDEDGDHPGLVLNRPFIDLDGSGDRLLRHTDA